MGVDAGHGAEGVTHLLPGLKGTSGVSGGGGGGRHPMYIWSQSSA